MPVILTKDTTLPEFLEKLCSKVDCGWGTFYSVPFFMQKDKDGTVYLHELNSSDVPTEFKDILKKQINEGILEKH